MWDLYWHYMFCPPPWERADGFACSLPTTRECYFSHWFTKVLRTHSPLYCFVHPQGARGWACYVLCPPLGNVTFPNGFLRFPDNPSRYNCCPMPSIDFPLVHKVFEVLFLPRFSGNGPTNASTFHLILAILVAYL